MKRILGTILSVLLCMGILSGCGRKTNVDTSTVFIDKKGKVTSVDVEGLDRDYYDEEELESYITEHVAEYTQKNGDTVEKVSFGVTEGVAKLQMEYDSCEDYTGFNGIELYQGTVLSAQAEGYDFDTEFYSVGDDSEEEGAGKALKKEDVLADDDNKVVIIKANVNVQVPGSILYVSAQDTKVMDRKTVSITGEGADEEAELTYIIYK